MEGPKFSNYNSIHCLKETNEKMRFTLGPECCLFIASLPGIALGYGAPVHPMMMTAALPAEAVQEAVRKYFPETWIWDLVPLE